ncbi:hypothetical protein MMC18_004197 [Xylographa bjoerkii]|nr:hypothetical protein [Xylographa bjoerkii]
MSPLIINLQNQSGRTHNYILCQQTPAVADAGQAAWPLVIVNVRVPDEGSAKVALQIPDPYYAYAITTQAPSHGSSVETIAKRAVTLGKKQDDGTHTPGSIIQYVVTDEVPDLIDGALPKHGLDNAFEIRTGNDFTVKDAKKGNFLIGYGSQDQAYQAFMPRPNLAYQVIPSLVFYLNFADVTKGALIDTEVTGNPLEIDFSALDSPIRVTHNPDGSWSLRSVEHS